VPVVFPLFGWKIFQIPFCEFGKGTVYRAMFINCIHYEKQNLILKHRFNNAKPKSNLFNNNQTKNFQSICGIYYFFPRQYSFEN
jgi:hypothetical protein